MPKGRARAGVLTAFACWLVLLASGDDFNFARLALPSPPTSEDLLPPDDPNSDFTTSSPSSKLTTTSRDRGDCPSSAGRSVAGAGRTWLFATPPHSRSPRHSNNAPLRC